MKNLIRIMVLVFVTFNLVGCASFKDSVVKSPDASKVEQELEGGFIPFQPIKDKKLVKHAAEVVGAAFSKVFSCEKPNNVANVLYEFGYNLGSEKQNIQKGIFVTPICKILAPKILDYANDFLMKARIMKVGKCTGEFYLSPTKASVNKLCDMIPL